MKNRGFKTVLAAATLATPFLLATAAEASASAVKLLPHKAVYDLSLVDAAERSGIEAIEGRAAFDITGSVCEGYVLNTRLVFSTRLRTGRTVIADSRVSTFEAGDGSRLDFTAADYLNGQQTERTKGFAERAGETIRVELSEPEKEPFVFDGDPVFPALQMKRIIEAAEAGKTLVTMPLYDGTQSGDTLYQTTVIMTPLAAESAEGSLLEGAPSVDGAASWRVTISYFEDKGAVEAAQTPISEISFDLYDNGVTDNLVLDYGTYTLAGVLSEFNPGQMSPCE